LSGTPGVLWEILPLFVSTIIILLYFEKYDREQEDWADYISNSLVLLFISIGLLKYIYELDIFGAVNFFVYQGKSIATIFLMLIGMILLRFNFEHVLPKKLALHLSSTLTIHLIAYSVVLFVYSNLAFSWMIPLSLLVLIIIISAILHLFKMPLKRLFVYSEKLKTKERFENVKEAKFQISELENQLKMRKRELQKIDLKKAEKEKREALKLKKIIKGR
jgi:hypothetical protein